MLTVSELIKMDERYGARNYLPLPVMLSRGEGAWVWDVEGNRYLDMLAAYSALNFGHRRPELVSVLTQQASKLTLCSRAFHSEELALFCRDLGEFCGFEAVLPMNSGTEAVETALKIARKWGHEKKRIPEERANIVVMANNFHGRTITVVSFSTGDTYRRGFGPYTPGFRVVPFGDVPALREAVTSDTIAVLLEPIQAEAGILIPGEDYLPAVREICSQGDCLLILDEIQTGLCRTGTNFCYEQSAIVPDLLIVGKSLGGGLLPVSAVVTRREVMDVLQPGQHGSTFGGNPLAAAVARESLRLISNLNLNHRALQIGETVREILRDLKHEWIKDVRGRGALIGIELVPAAGGARRYCERIMKKGVLCKETHDHVIRISPPLTIEMNDLKWGVQRIADVISNS